MLERLLRRILNSKITLAILYCAILWATVNPK